MGAPQTSLLLLFIVIQILDAWTTSKGLSLGADEANVVASTLFKKLGFWPATLLVKGGVILMAVLVTLYMTNAWIITSILCLIGLYVLWSNYRVLAEQKRDG